MRRSCGGWQKGSRNNRRTRKRKGRRSWRAWRIRSIARYLRKTLCGICKGRGSNGRDEGESQLKNQAGSFSLKLAQGQEDAARQVEKVARQEKHRFERQQLEFEKTLREREEDFEHRSKQREQESTIAFEARLAE